MGIDVCLPDLGTPYWYVRVNPITGRFETRETSWQDYDMDRLRFASGNLFLTSKEAIDLERQQNDLMDNMPPANPGYKSYH